MDQMSKVSKALAAAVTCFLILRVKEYMHIEDMNLSTLVAMAIEAAVDALMAGVVYFFTWFIPLGRKYVEERIMGRHVVITNMDTGVQTVGQVTQVLTTDPQL